MFKIFPFLNTGEKYKIDFSLMPFGILLLEFSILSTDLSLRSYPSFFDIFLIRFFHALYLLIFSYLFSQTCQRRGRCNLSYFEVAIPATLAVMAGVFWTNFLAEALAVEPLSTYRSLASSALQGLFWFPMFILAGSQRTEIFAQFKEYEKRLIISTRALSRTSEQFLINQREIQQRIRLELNKLCASLRESISQVDIKNIALPEANAAIQQQLKGDELRKLSMNLETFGSARDNSSFLGQNIRSVRLLVTQFRILYAVTAQKAPLSANAYALILVVLITPAHINYFTPIEAAFSYPLLSLAIFAASRVIVASLRSDSPKRIRNSSILIYATGMLPLLANRIGQSFTHDPNTDFPLYIGLFSLPFGYYIFMKVLQVLHPQAIQLITKDELEASRALKDEVTLVVSDEFSHTLSHRWAIYIHGKILTRLAATALKMETASSAGDKETFTNAVDSLLHLLETPDTDFVQVPIDLESEVASRLDPWLGLLEVDLHIDQELKSIRNDKVRELGEVIEEIISNSMRHGKAQKVALRVMKSGESDIHISALDDSTVPPPAYQTRYGLGTRIFNLASDGRWSISRVDSGTEFMLTMAIED